MNRTTILLATLMLGACAKPSHPVKLTDGSSSPTEQVAQTLRAGVEARNAAERGRLAQRLAALGARPAVDGEPDFIAQWQTAPSVEGGTPVYRGRLLGPAYRRGTIVPGAAINIEQLFLAGHAAEVVVSPSPSSRLDLSVYDPDGRAVCQSIIQQPTGKCIWRPAFSERFRVTIENKGRVEADYFIVLK